MIKMRVTIDYDGSSRLGLYWRVIKGIILCKKLPSKIYKVSKGWHIIWNGLNINEEKMLRYRKTIGDDKNRIKLDSLRKKAIKQVLFKEKKTICNGFLHWSWNKHKKNFVFCPICNYEIERSEKIFSNEKKGVFIYHKNSNHICELPIPKG